MCPECKEPVLVLELEGVEIDHCVSCQGTWLDDGELEMITGLAGVQPGPITSALQFGKSSDRSQRRCPRCGSRLQILSLESTRPIELDRCPLGHGLWLDKGEMMAVIFTFGNCEAGETKTVANFFSSLYQKEFTKGE